LNDPHLNVPEICFQKYVACDALGEMEGYSEIIALGCVVQKELNMVIFSLVDHIGWK
jgi:hypothetical protein